MIDETERIISKSLSILVFINISPITANDLKSNPTYDLYITIDNPLS